jgi:hypothetical protein
LSRRMCSIRAASGSRCLYMEGLPRPSQHGIDRHRRHRQRSWRLPAPARRSSGCQPHGRSRRWRSAATALRPVPGTHAAKRRRSTLNRHPQGHPPGTAISFSPNHPAGLRPTNAGTLKCSWSSSRRADAAAPHFLDASAPPRLRAASAVAGASSALLTSQPQPPPAAAPACRPAALRRGADAGRATRAAGPPVGLPHAPQPPARRRCCAVNRMH